MPAAANEIVHLTNVTESVLTPQWSPDGNRIAYVSSSSGYKAEIWIMDNDGDNKQQITTGISGYEFNDPWSTDGTKLAYSSLEYWLISGLWIYDVYAEEKHTLKGIKNIDSYQWVNG
jgi:Tol biopolymer transport system component